MCIFYMPSDIHILYLLTCIVNVYIMLLFTILHLPIIFSNIHFTIYDYLGRENVLWKCISTEKIVNREVFYNPILKRR